eukprot:759394-Hanusia_phi.AAC.6
MRQPGGSYLKEEDGSHDRTGAEESGASERDCVVIPQRHEKDQRRVSMGNQHGKQTMLTSSFARRHLRASRDSQTIETRVGRANGRDILLTVGSQVRITLQAIAIIQLCALRQS